MGRFLKLTSYVLIAIVFSIALSGCTKKTTDDNTTIKVWSFESEDVWTNLKTDFEKENKGYTLVYEKQVFDSSYENRVLNSILSGTGPDIWSMPNDWVYRHKDKLFPRPAEDPAIDLDQKYVPSVKQSVYFDDKIYAHTPSAQPLIIYYNEKFFNTASEDYDSANPGEENKPKRDRLGSLLNNGFPQTWTDLSSLVQILTQKNGETITRSIAALGTDRLTYSTDILYLLMMQNGTNFLSEDKKLAVLNLPKETPKETTNTPGKEALAFFTSFADPKSPNYTWNNTFGNEVDAFANGKVGMIFGFDELQNTFAQKYPNFSYKKASIPQLTTEPKDFIDYAKFNAFGVNNLSDNPVLCWSLIDMLSGDYSSDFVAANRLYTSTKAADYDISMDGRNTDRPEKVSLATAKSLVKGRYPVEFDNAIKDMIFAVNLGIQDHQSALDLVATNLTSEYLRKESW